jgi:hypothetical protein
MGVEVSAAQAKKPGFHTAGVSLAAITPAVRRMVALAAALG